MAEALVVCRFLHISAAMLLFGISVFTRLLIPAGLRDDMQALQRRVTLALAPLVAVTAIIWLGLEAGEAGDGWIDTVSPDTLSSVITDTAFGQVWVWRLGLVVLLLAALALRGNAKRLALIFTSAGVLASLGFVGHAAMQEGIVGWAHRINHGVHLLAAGFWLGCLPPLLVCLKLLWVPSQRRDATQALKRFSGLGHVAVALVLTTGIVNTALLLGKVPLDFSSPYQSLLATKIGLVCLMVLIAIVNRYVIVPRLATDGPQAVRAIVVGTIAELTLGVAVIALVSAFATFDPV